MKFSIKELLSLVPEVKVEFEAVYNEKSKSLKILKAQRSFRVIDSEIEKYDNLATRLTNIFPGMIANAYTFPQIANVNTSPSNISWINIRFPVNISNSTVPITRAISGEEYIVLPLKKHNKNIFLPEMSVHFVIMYILGMISRYQPKEWGEIIKGEESGDVYVIQKFLKVTTRKFPNMILDWLRNRNYVFVSPRFESAKQLTDEQKRAMYSYIKDRQNREFRRQVPF